MDIALNDFISQLASKAPVPGGGGASALIGAIGVSLCSMVANLTVGKKKYADYQADMEIILDNTQKSIVNLMKLIEKDAEVFEPLSKAYGIPKEESGRDAILQNTLKSASLVPLEIMREISSVLKILDELLVKGSRLAISDVGVAASACKCALESAVMNVYINTKLMKDTAFAAELNKEAGNLLVNGRVICDRVYNRITEDLRCI